MASARPGSPGHTPHASRLFASGSIAGWMVGIGAVGFAMAPLTNPSKDWPLILKYVEVFAVVAATFFARFGPDHRSGWCFGFAALGWSNLVIFQGPAGWSSGSTLSQMCGLDSLESWLDSFVLDLLGAELYPTARDIPLRVSVAAVVHFWISAILALAGGAAGDWLARRGRRKESTRGADDA